MGLMIFVYKHIEPNGEVLDCTNKGISHDVSRLLLVNANGPFQAGATNTYPCVKLEQHVPGCLRLVPCNDKGEVEPRGYMAGGNYAGCSDSRFGELCERLLGRRFYGLVAIHDRVE